MQRTSSTEASLRQRRKGAEKKPISEDKDLRKPRVVQQNSPVTGSLALTYYLSLVALSCYGLYWVPQSLPLSAPLSVFSEDRALAHATYLSEAIGDRLVGTPNVEIAAQYILKELHAIAREAQDTDFVAQVDREQATGGLNADFAGVRVASAYKNLTNIVLYIAPSAASVNSTLPALLLNAHYDSVFGTTGASDCASCVGVMLEIARTLVASRTALHAPVILLFNGGEETLLLAAHGFMQSSKWAARVGAFINLESTGPGGPAYLFQHTAGWTVRAYARAAKYPQGSVCGQDFFDSRILKMDTDFRMFSSQHHGSLPGIDIAYIMDGSAYHTKQDTVARIRKGTVQASGENILEAAKEFTARLAAPGGPPADDNAVFFDVFGRLMVTYSWRVGRALHTLPLLFVTVATMVLLSTNVAALPSVLTAAGLTAAAPCAAVLLSAGSGIVRVAITGRSMVWFGKPLVFASMYGPAAFAGLLLPYAICQARLPSLSTLLLGFGLVQGIAAACLTAINAKSGFMSAAWAATATVGALLFRRQETLNLRRVVSLFLLGLPASVVTMPFVACLPVFVMEHISISGARPPPLGPYVSDAAVGAVMGLAVHVTGAFAAVLLVHMSRRSLWVFVSALLAITAICSLVGVGTASSYSTAHPKRVVVQHLHYLDGSSGGLAESRWSLAGLDSVPVGAVLPAAAAAAARDATPGEWQGLFPLSALMRGVSLPAGGPGPGFLDGPGPVQIRRVSIERRHGSRGVERWHMEMQTALPPWGTFNVTGNLTGWSFAEGIQPNYIDQAGATSYMVRFASNDNRWAFWMDVERGSAVKIVAAILFVDSTPELMAFTAELPAWANAMPMTAFHATFDIT